MAVPYIETSDVVESRGRLFVGGRRFTVTDYRRMRRGLDKAVALLESFAEEACPKDLCGVPCFPCEAEHLLRELRVMGVLR